MYELFVALKYLIPQKKSLSTAVISLIAFIVISLVVWLTLVFLSVTKGLEHNWLKKLTSLNAPIRITPTENYYKSYYYLIDSISADSFYETKTIGEKKTFINHYSKDEDMEVPSYWKSPDLDENGNLRDYVHLAYQNLSKIKLQNPTLTYQDYETSAAFMSLTLNKNAFKTSYLSQMTYILSLAESNPNFQDLLIEPTTDDILYLLTKPTVYKSVLENIQIKQVKLQNPRFLPIQLLPENTVFNAKRHSDTSKHFILSKKQKDNFQIIKINNKIHYLKKGKKIASLNIDEVFLNIDESIVFDVDKNINQNKKLQVKGLLQNKRIQGILYLDQCQIIEAKTLRYFEKKPKTSPPWIFHVKQSGWILPNLNDSYGVLLPKSFRKNKVLLGDSGYFGYSSVSSTSAKEMRSLFYVAGFYDPGVFPLGNRFLIAPMELIRIINSTSLVTANEVSNNGIFVWNSSLKDAKKIKTILQDEFKAKKIDPYWKIESYEDFEFSKDLFQQFQSDKLLFTLVAIIILMVACSNIVSMLILLVNDKKKEIAILMSIGANKKSIALIFGACGFITGFLSSATGILMAILTLKHIDKVALILSSIQGHDAFNAAFFGNSLPNTLSSEALLFILIATPIISLLAGLIPAYKAARLNPSQILRS